MKKDLDDNFDPDFYVQDGRKEKNVITFRTE